MAMRSFLLFLFSFLLFWSESHAQTAPVHSSGFDVKKLEQITTRMDQYVDDHAISGIVTLIARHGTVVQQHAYGHRDIDKGLPMDVDTIFRLASMTKPFTSVALMQLWEQDHFSLDDPVSASLPEFASTPVYGDSDVMSKAPPITIRDVLMHTSGITAGMFGEEPVHHLYRNADFHDASTLADFTDRLAQLPLLHAPGTAWSYGYSTDVVARLVEVFSGLPFEEYVMQNIVNPLGLSDTGFAIPPDKWDRVATAYSSRNGELEPRTVAMGPRFARGNSGMHSTVSDYFRFAQMLLNGGSLDGVQILKPETVDLMTQNHLPQELIPIAVLGNTFTNNGFGLGFSVVTGNEPNPPQSNGFWWNDGGRPSVGSYWWIGALQTYFWVDPALEIIGLVMTQSTDLLPFAYKQEFHTSVYEALLDSHATEVNGSTMR